MYRDDKGRLEYPPEHAGRKTYVTVAGVKESVPVIYTYYYGGRHYLIGDQLPDGAVAPMIMSDMQPYKSPLDGSWVTSRSQHRAHMRQHGVIEVGNERLGRNRAQSEMPRAGYDIKRAMQCR